MAEKFAHSVVQCLAAIAQHQGIRINPERLIHDFALADEEPKAALVLRMAADIGMKAKADNLSWQQLVAQQGVFPLLGRLKTGAGVIVVGVKKEGDAEQVAIVDPLADAASVTLHTEATFCEVWGGDVILLKRAHSLFDTRQPFGLRWFIPEILKQRTAFRDVIIAGMSMNVLALAAPLFFQLVIDKVLVHQSSSTLAVLTIGVTVALLFDSAFGYLRQMLLLAATNKIDMHVTRRTFGHLLSLSIDFFELSTAGVITRQMQQLEGIRQFLTGRLLFAGLDAFALVIFLPLLFTYSVTLALIVLAFTLAIAAIIAILLPTFRQRLDRLNLAEGARQALLVEAIHGMRTIKSLAIEPVQRKAWDQMSAEAINAHFQVGKLAISGNSLTDFLGKLMPVVIIFIGAQSVFDQTMTVGVLIAFQMLSGRVVGPLIQMVSLINEYQQTALSVRMLAEIMNRPSEGRLGAGGLRPQLKGQITFEDVTFRYPGGSVNALDRTSFTIPPGAVVGIVGRSGSGKTTLTKLIQGLYSVQEGLVRFDGIDAREIDLSHLRRQIGVVLQENFLFRGTIRENLAMAKPDASIEEIVAAAQAAGADEFIDRMAKGYDTLLEENASNLSGGQRQRLSIARCLLAKPNILILDEAASALDPESEAIFIRNLSRIAVGRTVMMISHRLSTLVNADVVLVMQHGRLSDWGKHEELLSRCETYQHLWNQQTSHL
ncbi:MAG: peptidase domain-containing ABC transporter [Candidatus Accumulibacter phosphatis]|uniref:peptidase domain-containing ABC transporter n=1 Tax=Candidatus Accumulibacter phosphatis TaxID=327160 RepID=UPI001A4DE627|nr:peptidase domain-containing ABC transporter [Candidatus Accumulibacter phosphatis]